jgi:hypothetical protein
VVFNKNIMSDKNTSNNLGTALDKASHANIPMMCKPFHRPFQYMGMQVPQAEKSLDVKAMKLEALLLKTMIVVCTLKQKVISLVI